MVSNVILVTFSLTLGTLILLSTAAESVPYIGHRGYLGDLESEPDPEVILEILAKLGQTIMRANDLENYYKGYLQSSKRGLDLGLSRGFSGSQAAKHLMGLAAANYAGGPGRRRRQA
ncbi:diuretic hormone class 2 isoform X1 [Halyomorpha halys]|uniref:diuretic hormone class 2 isoform X1 n=1 Tax=Halyomorpha halys TaxID=286706 RepID=UPI000D0C873D|nr:diuretic hormone class 2 isoform X1 [Halyomorpha halys]